MLDWLLSPIDASRAHEVGVAISWHARAMVLGWGILAPLAVLVARFFKVMPGQNWPQDLDNQVWWRSHWKGQVAVLILSVIGFILVWPLDFSDVGLHAIFGYLVLLGLVAQVLLGVFRGSKGGPTARAADGSPRGHHYDMTPWRRMFEALHKSIGYGIILLAMITILMGLWTANGPIWMWLVMCVWWAVLLAVFVVLQNRGMAIDTYQAIWGPDPQHPGNTRAAPGWGMRRFGEREEDNTDVRSDRRDRVRGS